MHKHSNNRIVVDLKKVQWAKHYWINQYGNRRDRVPDWNSVRMEHVSENKYAYWHPDYPCETEYERAVRLDLLDVWQPVCYLQLTANHSLTYTGAKALSIWKEWCSMIFNKKKKDK